MDTAAADLPAAAPVSVEAALAVGALIGAGSTGAGFAVVLMAAGLVLASMGATLAVAVFVATAASAVIGFAIVTSTTSFSSGILGTRSFTIRMGTIRTRTTGIIPMAITLTGTVMDTVAFAAVAFAAVALAAVALAAVALAAVGDPYHQPFYQGSAGCTDELVGQIQLRLARAGYYHGAVDGVSGNATRRAIRDYQRAHSLPADGQIRGRLLTSMGLG